METSIRYIARTPILQIEKAFSTDFPIDHVVGVENIRARNIEHEDRAVTVEAVEDPRHWKLDVHGFCFLKSETHIDPDQVYKNRKDVQSAYWYEIEAILHEHFPQYSRFEAFDLKPRKRDAGFPQTSRNYHPEYENPARGAHADFSQQGAYMILEHIFPGQAEYWKDKEFDIINVWRPLRDTTDDWPLALCDYTTVDPDNDLVLNDSIRRDLVMENTLMHYSSAHRWYYLKDHGVNDLLVFRNANSDDKRPRAFHAAFHNPESTGPPRESVEVRLVAFY